MRKHLPNIIGVISGFAVALGLPSFAIWQWDIILSGCVWWTDGVHGWAWNGAGAYASAPFKCWLWLDTVGGAYDKLLFLIFLGVIVGVSLVFLSVWYWTDE